MYFIVILIAKIINLISSVFSLGAGFTWPGYIALKLYPSLLSKNKFIFKDGIILVSGTNGKTTTTKIITHLLEQNNFKVLHNKSGSNTLNGICSALLLDRNLLHHLD